MKLVTTLAIAGLLAFAVLPASAQITNIDDIQAYSVAGAPISPFSGATVTVRGTITCQKGTYNSGTHYIEDATGGIQFFDAAAPVFLLGQVVDVTGVVGSFSGEIQLVGPLSYTVVSTGAPLAPTELTVQQLLDLDLSGTVTAGDYEVIGMLIASEGTVCFRPGIDANPLAAWTQGTFGLANAMGDTATIFIDSTTGIETGSLNPGDTFRCIGPVANFNGLIEMKPRFQADLVENPGDPFPLVQDIAANPWTPEALQSIDISATITDNGTISSATLYYRDRGQGSFNSSAMIDGGGGSYSATIPGTTAAGVEYYIEATDNSAQTTLVPGDAPTGFREVAVGTTSIIEIQSTLQEGTDISAFGGQLVNVEGVVVAAPGELQVGGQSNYVVQDPAGGQWSGIWVFEGSGANTFFRGDVIRISGRISEFQGTTEILPQSGASIEFVGFGADLPSAPILSTDVMDASEAYESVVVATFHTAVQDTFAGGTQWTLKDAPSDSSVYVSPAPAVTATTIPGQDLLVTGVLDTRFGRNDLVPLDDTYIVFADLVATPPSLAHGPSARFESISPNPFNPRATIKYSLSRAGMAELVIFDSRGRRVNTLVAGKLDAGEHVAVWEGVDQSGVEVSTGVYYARLRFAGEFPQVEKLTLTK